MLGLWAFESTRAVQASRRTGKGMYGFLGAPIFVARARSALHASDGAGAQTFPRYQQHRESRKAET